MTKRSILFVSVIIVFSMTCCIKETYDMRMLSKKAHLSPTLKISAVFGNISFKDMVKKSDMVRFDETNFVTIVIKKDSVVDLKLADFSKGSITRTAPIEPNSFVIDEGDIFNHISGTFLMSDPLIKFNYSNSFADAIKLSLNVSGRNKEKTVNLNLAPFAVQRPNLPAQQEIIASYLINKTNSSLPQMISILPKVIDLSGTAELTSVVKSGPDENNILAPNHLLGSIEIDLPLSFSMTNLQFADTLDNFIRSDSTGKDNSLKPEDFQMLQLIVKAKNGFPLGASMKMSLYDSKTKIVKSTVEASGILAPAPVDNTGKATSPAETTATIDFTRDFFSKVKDADKIIFLFTFNTTGNGTKDIRIYSDTRIDFTAAMAIKPDLNLK